jgi:2-methylaconitate cis-trans-isomerase PrpF
MAIVGPAATKQADMDIVARVINTAKVYKAYAVSGAICLAAVSAIKGTLVNEIVKRDESPFTLRIGHPSGTLNRPFLI